MKISNADFDKAKESFVFAKNCFNIAGDALSDKEPKINKAMHYLSMSVRFMLQIICVKYGIEYEESDEFVLFFKRTRRFLAGDIFAYYILTMETELLSWQYCKTSGIKTTEEAAAVAKKLETYFNNVIRRFMTETKNALEWPEDDFGGSGIF